MSANNNNNNINTFTARTPFPHPNKHNVAILLINSSGLASAEFDAVHLTKLCDDYQRYENLYILVDSPDAMQRVQSQTTYHHNTEYSLCNTADKLLNKLDEIATLVIKDESCVLFAISSHGYCHSSHCFISWQGQQLNAMDFHVAFLSRIPEAAWCVSLVDACACGSLLSLNFESMNPESNTWQIATSLHDDSHPNLVCIAAVDNQESDMDDISEIGFDGGLTASWIDYHLDELNQQRTPMIGEFFTYYRNRVKAEGVHPVISTNTRSFYLLS